MNPMFLPTVLLGILFFWLGHSSHRWAQAYDWRNILWLGAIWLATPGIIFAVYYTKLLGEPLWLYRFRAWPGTELSAAGMGLLAGMLQAKRASWPRFRKHTSRLGVPLLFGFALSLPFLKPLLLPVRWPQHPSQWRDNVCLQSTPSSCGPASAATLARLAGVNIEERDLARESFTSAGGTENWYLARALRRHGLDVRFETEKPEADALPCPAIAGVKLSYGTGHFIPILGRAGTNYLVGDPMRGREVISLAELRKEYQFTGFFLLVK